MSGLTDEQLRKGIEGALVLLGKQAEAEQKEGLHHGIEEVVRSIGEP